MIQYSSNDTTGKLILLYVLDKMECELTEDTIIDMCYFQTKWVSYFTCKIALNELVKSEFIQEVKSIHKDKYYKITNEGRSCLSYFFAEIPTSLKEEIAEFIGKNKLVYKRKQEYFSDLIKNKDGSYTVILKILEPTSTDLEVKLNASNQQVAKDIQRNWQENASKIYANIFDTLLS